MLADLPRACDVGTKRNAKGRTTSWIVRSSFPISCIMTSASTMLPGSDSVGTLTAGIGESLYDRMVRGSHDSIEPCRHTASCCGHKPIIDVNPDNA